MNIGNSLGAPHIVLLQERKFVGMRQSMSFAQDTTGQLWASFMPRRFEVQKRLSADLFSVQNYPAGFFSDFKAGAGFEKWATVWVPDFDEVPPGMETMVLPGGKYAVFHYKGNPTNGTEVFRYILGEWLPESGFKLDVRPHFEILGDKYRNGSDDSEEDIYIPVI